MILNPDQEKEESLITLPESSAVVKALLVYCYSRRKTSELLWPDDESQPPTLGLVRLTRFHVAADKYDFPALATEVDSSLGNVMSEANEDIFALISRRDAETEDDNVVFSHLRYSSESIWFHLPI
jgi:hypothetical protein